MPWSVLGGGALSGKYRRDPVPEDRFIRYENFQKRFHSSRNLDVIEQYRTIAEDAGISLATLAQAWVGTRWFVPSTIIAATNLTQLKENIDAFSVPLSDSVLRKVNSVHETCKDPYLLGHPTGPWDPRGAHPTTSP